MKFVNNSPYAQQVFSGSWLNKTVLAGAVDNPAQIAIHERKITMGRWYISRDLSERIVTSHWMA